QQVQGQQLNITINDELRTYVDPLTPAEHEALERSLLTEGCREALILWRDVLIDGHNRYAICTQHNIPFRTVQNDSFESIEDVKLWMIDNQLARRSARRPDLGERGGQRRLAAARGPGRGGGRRQEGTATGGAPGARAEVGDQAEKGKRRLAGLARRPGQGAARPGGRIEGPRRD